MINICIILTHLLIPFLNSASLILNLDLLAGLAGAATSLTAGWYKSDAIKNDSVKVKNFLGDLEKKDTVVNQEVKNLKEKADSMRSAYDNKAVVDWLKDDSAVGEWYAAAGIQVGFQRHRFAVCFICKSHDFGQIKCHFLLHDRLLNQGTLGKNKIGIYTFV